MFHPPHTNSLLTVRVEAESYDFWIRRNLIGHFTSKRKRLLPSVSSLALEKNEARLRALVQLHVLQCTQSPVDPLLLDIFLWSVKEMAHYRRRVAWWSQRRSVRIFPPLALIKGTAHPKMKILSAQVTFLWATKYVWSFTVKQRCSEEFSFKKKKKRCRSKCHLFKSN